MTSTTGAELDRTVDACVALLGSMAQTIAARPHSTVAPAGRASQAGRVEGLLAELASGDDPLRIESTLGEGGMGVVYLATQTTLRRKVAVKMLRPEERTVLTTAQLIREAWITGSLEHPNVLPIYDVHLDHDGAPRIVLKRIEGTTWHELMHDQGAMRERFGSPDIVGHNLRVLMQLCHAAHFAHSKGIVHRDLKPSNVMIGEFGEVYLHDWGIAVSLEDGGELSDHGLTELAGTPAYMAPEMLRPEIAPLSPRTDVYLLGGILYEIVSGRPPHDAGTPQEIIKSILASRPRYQADAPEELVAIARRAMSANPSARFDTAEELRLELQDYMQHRSSALLAREAELTLERLELLVRGERAAAASVQIAEKFGACRFGFKEALEMWPDNATACAGLDRAMALMVEHEAAHGRAETAAEMLADIAAPSAELVARVDEAKERAAAERQRVAELERVGMLLDPRFEIRARWIVTSLLALLGTIVPLATQQLVDPTSERYGPLFPLPACFLVAAIGAAIWKRHALARTVHNRVVLAMVIAALSGQLMVHAASATMALPVVASMAMVALLWSVLAAMVTVIVDARVAAIALGYLGALLAIALLAHTRRDANYIMSMAHLVTTLTVFTIWRPSRQPDVPPRSGPHPEKGSSGTQP